MAWLPGPWASSLPNEYYREMEGLLMDLFENKWSLPKSEIELMITRYLFGRMEIVREKFIPWMRSGIPNLNNLIVLEVGCGNASVTVPVAQVCAHVKAFDLPGPNNHIAERRLQLLNIKNVSLSVHDEEWINEYSKSPKEKFGNVDIILCHAVLEHLTIKERLRFLRSAWDHLPLGGYLIVIETHNRLYYYDWHSSLMPFFDQLPDDLALLWLAKSDRKSIPSGLKVSNLNDIDAISKDGLYRFGRGCSFHEFYISIGEGAFENVEPWIIDRTSYPGWNQEYIDILKRQLGEITPPVHYAFAQPSLDFIIRKTAPPAGLL